MKTSAWLELQTVRQIRLDETGRRERHHALCAEERAATGGVARGNAGAHAGAGHRRLIVPTQRLPAAGAEVLPAG